MVKNHWDHLVSYDWASEWFVSRANRRVDFRGVAFVLCLRPFAPESVEITKQSKKEASAGPRLSKLAKKLRLVLWDVPVACLEEFAIAIPSLGEVGDQVVLGDGGHLLQDFAGKLRPQRTYHIPTLS